MQQHQSAAPFHELIDTRLLCGRKHFMFARVQHQNIALLQLRFTRKFRAPLHKHAPLLQQLRPIAQELRELVRPCA